MEEKRVTWKGRGKTRREWLGLEREVGSENRVVWKEGRMRMESSGKRGENENGVVWKEWGEWEESAEVWEQIVSKKEVSE